MARKGEDTRERILDAAQGMILDGGFAGMSVEQLIKSLGLTKGAFFHHFKSKHALARALIQRYSDEGIQLFQDFLARAKRLSDDPLQQLLILIGSYEEIFEGLKEPYPGCLLASYVYELQQFDEDTRKIINQEFLLSRKELSKLIRQVSKKYPPALDVNDKSLADGFMAIFEGAFILSKSLHEAGVTAQQLRHYRNYIQLLFRP
jgi:TetR/AcrR family transcriptional repressor of nem operon